MSKKGIWFVCHRLSVVGDFGLAELSTTTKVISVWQQHPAYHKSRDAGQPSCSVAQ